MIFLVLAVLLCGVSLYIGYSFALWRMYGVMEDAWDLNYRMGFFNIVIHSDNAMRTIAGFLSVGVHMEDDLK